MIKIFYLLLFISTVSLCESNYKFIYNYNNDTDCTGSKGEEFLDKAIELTKKNNSQGLIWLYDISINDLKYSVETSEIAGDYLTYFLNIKTELWVKTFAQIKIDNFNEYIRVANIGGESATTMAYFKSFKSYLKKTINNLKKIKTENNNEKIIIDELLDKFYSYKNQ